MKKKNQERGKHPMVTTTMRVPKKILKAADRRAKSKALSRSRYIVSLIEEDANVSLDAPPKPVTDADVFG